jgi:hypothetical protein
MDMDTLNAHTCADTGAGHAAMLHCSDKFNKIIQHSYNNNPGR